MIRGHGHPYPDPQGVALERRAGWRGEGRLAGEAGEGAPLDGIEPQGAISASFDGWVAACRERPSPNRTLCRVFMTRGGLAANDWKSCLGAAQLKI